MGNIWLGFLFWFHFLLVVIGAIVIPGPSITNHIKVHQKRDQVPQKCDLICPGQPPLALPPNFIQNCTSVAQSSSKPNQVTTGKPAKTTTTESSEESTESSETDNQNSTARIGNHRKSRKRSYMHQTHLSAKSKQPHLKHNLKKTRVVLKHEVKFRLLKDHKGLKDKLRLDGCYVVCSEENGGGNSPLGSDDEPSESGSSESDQGDDYVEGEDTPIEIIYIPQADGLNKRPSEIYQINNYELVNPQQALSFGYDPFLIEDKSKKMKKRKQYIRKSGDDMKFSNKRHPNKSTR